MEQINYVGGQQSQQPLTPVGVPPIPTVGPGTSPVGDQGFGGGFAAGLFRGRLSRINFNFGLLLQAVIILPLVLIPALSFFKPGALASGLAVASGPMQILSDIAYALGVLATLSLSVRRLHDVGLNGWWAALFFVPVVDGLFILYLCFARGRGEINQWGEPDARRLSFRVIIGLSRTDAAAGGSKLKAVIIGTLLVTVVVLETVGVVMFMFRGMSIEGPSAVRDQLNTFMQYASAGDVVGAQAFVSKVNFAIGESGASEPDYVGTGITEADLRNYINEHGQKFLGFDSLSEGVVVTVSSDENGSTYMYDGEALYTDSHSCEFSGLVIESDGLYSVVAIMIGDLSDTACDAGVMSENQTGLVNPTGGEAIYGAESVDQQRQLSKRQQALFEQLKSNFVGEKVGISIEMIDYCDRYSEECARAELHIDSTEPQTLGQYIDLIKRNLEENKYITLSENKLNQYSSEFYGEGGNTVWGWETNSTLKFNVAPAAGLADCKQISSQFFLQSEEKMSWDTYRDIWQGSFVCGEGNMLDRGTIFARTLSFGE
jgi:uncharacterized membrane protein YhaH (DUF805 family)